MHIGNFEYRPEWLESVQVDRTDVIVFFVGRIHCASGLLWCPRGSGYATVETVSFDNFVDSMQGVASIL